MGRYNSQQLAAVVLIVGLQTLAQHCAAMSPVTHIDSCLSSSCQPACMHRARAAFGASSQRTQNICITFIQCRPNVFDVGPTLYECYTNILCLLGCGVAGILGKHVTFMCCRFNGTLPTLLIYPYSTDCFIFINFIDEFCYFKVDTTHFLQIFLAIVWIRWYLIRNTILTWSDSSSTPPSSD